MMVEEAIVGAGWWTYLCRGWRPTGLPRRRAWRSSCAAAAEADGRTARRRRAGAGPTCGTSSFGLFFIACVCGCVGCVGGRGWRGLTNATTTATTKMAAAAVGQNKIHGPQVIMEPNQPNHDGTLRSNRVRNVSLILFFWFC